MKKIYVLFLFAVIATLSNVCDAKIYDNKYTFTDVTWNSDHGQWTSIKDGYMAATDEGDAKKGIWANPDSGSCGAICPDEYADIKSVDVAYYSLFGFQEPIGTIDVYVDDTLVGSHPINQYEDLTHFVVEDPSVNSGRVKFIVNPTYGIIIIQSVTVNIYKPDLPAPTMNFVDGGTYHTEEPLVITSHEDGAEINYYIDYDYDREYYETAPSVEVYFSETGIHVVEAYIVKPGYAQSETTSVVFMVKEKLGGVPVFSLSEGTYGTGKTLTITSSKKSAKVCYMLNDDYIIETGESTATIELPAVAGEVKTYTVTAYEETENGVSDKVTKVYVIDEKTLDPPTFSLAPGLYGTTQSVTITAREGSTIMYMLNEDIEEAPSPVVVELPVVEGQQIDYTLTALASLDGYKDSDEAKAVYSIYPGYEGKTATLDIPKYALENKWIDNYEYYTAQVDDVTFALDEDIILCGTYYVDVDAWTPGLDGKITISVPDKHVLSSIVFTLAEVNSSYIKSADKGELDLNEWKATDKETSEVTFGTYDTIYLQKVQVNYSYFPTSSVSSVSTSADIRVVEADGGITIEADKTADVTVYNISGQVVSACRVAEGTTHIDLPTGFYIVRAAGTAAKVAVK